MLVSPAGPPSLTKDAEGLLDACILPAIAAKDVAHAREAAAVVDKDGERTAIDGRSGGDDRGDTLMRRGVRSDNAARAFCGVGWRWHREVSREARLACGAVTPSGYSRHARRMPERSLKARLVAGVCDNMVACGEKRLCDAEADSWQAGKVPRCRSRSLQRKDQPNLRLPDDAPVTRATRVDAIFVEQVPAAVMPCGEVYKYAQNLCIAVLRDSEVER